MDMFEFFFPQQAQAAHLRRIANSTHTANVRSRAQRQDVEALIRENQELRLHFTALVQTLVEKGLITPEEVQQRVQQLLPSEPELSKEPEENPFVNLKLQ